MQYSEEQIKDVQERVDKFNNEVKRLQGELEVSIVSTPTFVPTQVGFTTRCEIQIMDTKYIPKKETKEVKLEE